MGWSTNSLLWSYPHHWNHPTEIKDFLQKLDQHVYNHLKGQELTSSEAKKIYEIDRILSDRGLHEDTIASILVACELQYNKSYKTRHSSQEEIEDGENTYNINIRPKLLKIMDTSNHEITKHTLVTADDLSPETAKLIAGCPKLYYYMKNVVHDDKSDSEFEALICSFCGFRMDLHDIESHCHTPQEVINYGNLINVNKRVKG